MSGVFSAGVAAGLQEMDAYGKIAAVYGSSAGVLCGAYFLTRQAEIGSTIFEDLTRGFVKPLRAPVGLSQRVWNRYVTDVPKESIWNVLDIDRLFQIVEREKPLDLARLKEQEIPLYAKLLDTASGEIEYVDARRGDSLSVLRAAVSIAPYYFQPVTVEGKDYIDGSVKEPLGLEKLLERHPENRIVAVINEPVGRGLKHYAKNLAEGGIASLMYGLPVLSHFLRREGRVRQDIQKAMEHERVTLIHPPANNPTVPRTTKLSKLWQTYQMGRKEAQKLGLLG